MYLALRRWARPRQTAIALPLVLPAATVWTALVSSCRAEAGIPAGYVVAVGPLAYFVLADARSHRLVARVGLLTSIAGIGAAFSPFDIVTLFTGVTQ
ncbi:hypothetical protein [Streptomyces hainanensis]|uniref:Uncharacterized protein n=1 Tax=Streptomyces hainanensis TaxID=402648 RepID=A0A4R4SHQ8_9ACTN|nr:hypothetical protein [Streptomyces hainanensis]TDC62236.1 hypothetical protein E1283_34430 [Streptomyces hainanensis]